MADQLSCEYAYIAGLLDADGWIAVSRRNYGTTHGANVGIVNRDLSVLCWVQDRFGGNIVARKINRKSPHARNWSQTYDLNFGANESLTLLTLLEPYLRIKKQQAKLVLELLGLRQDRRKEYRIPPEKRQRQEEIYQTVRQLNHAGVQPVLLS